jgi:hypothetical protein
MHPRAILVAAALLGLLAPTPALSAEITQRKRAADAAPCTAATHAALPAAQPDGTLCTVSADSSAWRYNATTGQWLMPDVQPTALISRYEGDVLPALAAPAWTKSENDPGQSESTDGDILTVVDTSGSGSIGYQLRDAHFATDENILLMARLRVTAQDVAAHKPARVMLGMLPGDGTANGASVAIAGATALSGAGSQYWGDITRLHSAAPSYSVDNAAWQTYYLLYRAATGRFEYGVLGVSGAMGSVNISETLMAKDWDSCSLASCTFSVRFALGGVGTSYGADYTPTATVEFDWVMVGNFL